MILYKMEYTLYTTKLSQRITNNEFVRFCLICFVSNIYSVLFIHKHIIQFSRGKSSNYIWNTVEGRKMYILWRHLVKTFSDQPGIQNTIVYIQYIIEYIHIVASHIDYFHYFSILLFFFFDKVQWTIVHLRIIEIII